LDLGIDGFEPRLDGTESWARARVLVRTDGQSGGLTTGTIEKVVPENPFLVLAVHCQLAAIGSSGRSRSHPESKRSVYNGRWKSSKISQKSPSDGHINEHFI